jgi:hypothetical protein
VYESYYKRPISLDDGFTKASFTPANKALPGIVYNGEVLKDLDLLVHLYHNQDLFYTLEEDIEKIRKNLGINPERYDSVVKIYKTCYDEDKEFFISNVKDYLRTIIPCGLSDFVIASHMTTDERMPELYMCSLFPNSTNLSIVCSDEAFNRYFRLLGYHKFYKRVYNMPLKDSYAIVRSLNGKLLQSFQREYLSDLGEVKIFIDKFLFEENMDYVHEVEKLFSTIMAADITFNYALIEDYRKRNRRIIAEYLDTNDEFIHDNFKVLSKLYTVFEDIKGNRNVKLI